MKNKKARVMHGAVAALFGLAIVLFLFLAVLYLQPGPMLATLRGFWKQKLLIALNLFPIAALFLACVFLLQNVFFAGAASGLVWMLLSYINLVKMSARGDPFVPGDVMLLAEGVEAVGAYSLNLELPKLLVIAAVFAILVLLGVFWKTPKLRIPVRAVGLVLVLAAFLGSMFTVYPSKPVYDGIKGTNHSNVPAVFNNFGFPYCFLHNFNLYPVDKPEGYSERTASGFAEQYGLETSVPEQLPNIVMIMCEAFSDVPNWEPFTYSEEENPIAPYNALAADPSTVSGHMVVSNIGAGTANTEFDVLTGMMTNRLSPATSSALRVVHRNTPSLAYMLRSVGYHAFFTHPGQAWFYNRESVFGYFGFEDLEFDTDYEGMEKKGERISDAAFLEKLKSQLEARQGSPLFAYGTTIQNHQGYPVSKYDYAVPAVQTDLPLSQAASDCLSIYFEGLRDSANMLQELTKYLDTCGEPYILVFFGDHQPTLGASFMAYEELGRHYLDPSSVEDRLQMYEVPFLIWANSAYLADHELAADAAALGVSDGARISSHYLGAFATRLAGIAGADAYFDYLNEMRAVLPVDSVYGYCLPDGSCLETLPDDLMEMETIRWQWQYYRLKTEKPVK